MITTYDYMLVGGAMLTALLAELFAYWKEGRSR